MILKMDCCFGIAVTIFSYPFNSYNLDKLFNQEKNYVCELALVN